MTDSKNQEQRNTPRRDRREYAAAWYAANREKVRAQQAAYRAANREQRRVHNIAYRAANREKLRDYQRAWYTAKAHGLSPGDWAAMWAAQDGRCYLCGRGMDKEKAYVEHDHSCCGEDRSCRICRRGLACPDCNTSIGLAGDDPDRLRRMADALKAANAGVSERKAAAGEPVTLF